ncbi:hypothetical protein TWF730_004974 [Orbilia blumenaviensis]|uniref:H-type lectin domain-containing protein n=1 Tax=Orbilia blumenaviensis TaxID=1796055 RepID=A0AAV9VK67_9PEZI
MKDITIAMRPPDTGRIGATGRSDTPVPGLRRYIKPRAGSESSASSSRNVVRMKSPPPISHMVGGMGLQQSILDGYKRPSLSSESLRDMSDSTLLSPPGSWRDREKNNKSPFTESSTSSEMRKRKGQGLIVGASVPSSTTSKPSISSTSSKRGSSPTPSAFSGPDEDDPGFGLAKLRIRHGEPIPKRDWGSASDGSMPGQKVLFMTRFVTSLSDITEDMNISAARTVKRGRIDGHGGGSFIDVEKFKQADLNFYIRVRVTNQKIDVRDALQFDPEWVIEDGFTECFGDTFISGFIDGGEFNALLSIRVLNKAKVKDIEAGVESVFGNSLFTLDSLGKEEWERRDIDNSCEINVSAVWSGGGRLKSSEKQWPIHSLMEAAANFPDLVANEPHRIYAILTSYPYLQSFYDGAGELQIPFAPYSHAIQRSKVLLNAYLDYKSLRQRLDEDIADIQNGDKVFQTKEYFRRPSVQPRRDVSSAEDDTKFAHTIGELDQAIKAASHQMRAIMEEVDTLVRAPETAMEKRGETFQDPDVFRSRLPKVLPKTTKDIVARSAVVVQSDESELFLVSSGGSKANMTSGKIVPRVEEAENYHYAGSYSFVKNIQESSHMAKKVRNETQDQLPPRVFTGIRQLAAPSEAFTDPSLRFRMYSTNETAKGFDCCFHDWSNKQITNATFDVLAVNRSDQNFLTDSVEGRGVREWSIKFSKPFRRAPEIVIWLTGVDINRMAEAACTVDLEFRAVTTTGFRFLPRIPNPEIWSSFSWLAYNPDVGGITSGFLEFGSGKHDYGKNGRVEFPSGTFSQRPRVLAALHGFSLFPMAEDEYPSAKNTAEGHIATVPKGEIELEIGKTTMDGFNWVFRAAVPKGCKVIMQWVALA